MKTIVRFTGVKIQAVLFALVLVVIGCRPTTTDVATGPYATGVFIVNEGNFNSGDGKISYIERLGTPNSVIPDVFGVVNGRPLGDVVQSMTRGANNIYIVVNNSNKVEVVDPLNFTSRATITGFNLPRYALSVSASKLYVTEWLPYSPSFTPSGPGRVSIINQDNNTRTGTITVGQWPERMIQIGNNVYVANRFDNTVSVINTQTDQVTATITVGQGPNSFALDNNGSLWVLCGGRINFGNPSASIAGALVQINPNTNGVVRTIPITPNTLNPRNLIANPEGTVFYFMGGGGLFQYNVAAGAGTFGRIYGNGNLYGIGYEPSSRLLFIGVSGSPRFDNDGYVIRWSTLTQTIADSFGVKVGPSSFLF
jgi:YVTN family beta-propeller protein